MHITTFLERKSTKKFHFEGFLEMVKKVKTGQNGEKLSKW
jgi:hypothetical protein